MSQKLKLIPYALIALLVLSLPSQAVAQTDALATSCKGWECDKPGQICPQGVPGASDGDYICGRKNKWEKCDYDYMRRKCSGKADGYTMWLCANCPRTPQKIIKLPGMDKSFEIR